MNMKNRDSIFYSGWMKALGVVALCILGALLVWCGSSLVFREYYFSKETASAFEETEYCDNMMQADAENFIWSITNYGEDSVSQTEYGNLKYGIRNVTDDKQVVELPEKQYAHEEQFFIVADEYGNVYTVSSVSDADKTDIFRVRVEDDIRDIQSFTKEELEDSLVSDEVYKTFLSHQCINRETVVTPADSWIAGAAMIFDYNFKPGLAILKREKRIDGMMQRVHYTNPDTREKMEQVRNSANAWIESRL